MGDSGQNKKNLLSRDHLQIYEQYVVAFHNKYFDQKVNTLFEIRADRFEMITSLPWESIIRPFVVDDLERNKTGKYWGRNALADKYKVTPHTILAIGRDHGFYKKGCRKTDNAPAK